MDDVTCNIEMKKKSYYTHCTSTNFFMKQMKMGGLKPKTLFKYELCKKTNTFERETIMPEQTQRLLTRQGNKDNDKVHEKIKKGCNYSFIKLFILYSLSCAYLWKVYNIFAGSFVMCKALNMFVLS